MSGSGERTSEYKAVAAAFVAMVVAVVAFDDATTRIAAIAAATVVLVAYIWSRTALKR